MVGAWFAGSGVYQQIVFGALIFQLASILDGCDGELARLTFRTSRFGGWYEQLAGSLRYIIFFGALGVSAWLSTGSQIYIFAVGMLAALAVYMLSQMTSFAWNRRHEEPQSIIPEPDLVNAGNSLFGSIYNFWRELNKQDVMAFITFLFCIVFLYQAMFWLALLGTTAMPWDLIGVGAAAVHFQVSTGRIPLPAPGAQAPSVETIGAPKGRSGVHRLPNAGQSTGLS